MDLNKTFWRHSLSVCSVVPNVMNLLDVCKSVSCLISLLKLDKYGDISFSWWDLFLKFFGDIPEVFLHYFQTLIQFLYVCQSISWLTSLLKWGQYRDISSSEWEIFLKFLETFLGCLYTNSKYLWYFCMSVSLLVGLLPHRNVPNIDLFMTS